MATYLVADSGSTKTDWCLVKKGSKPVYFKTQGINPYIQSAEAISAMLQEELPWSGKKIAPIIFATMAQVLRRPKSN